VKEKILIRVCNNNSLLSLSLLSQNNYDHRSMNGSVGSVCGTGSEEGAGGGGGGNDDEAGPAAGESSSEPQETKSSDPAMPSPPPDLTLASTDIRIIKCCGVTGVVLAIIIFCSQVYLICFTR
jgi:hypothetical protein